MRTRFSFEKVLFATFLLVGLFYVGNAWSPSSYGIFLQQHTPDDTGIVWGQPRAIRSDEWAVVTPLTQATVNNNFERYNKTSFYNEDLRINYGLPIFDWGMVFKPTMWGYLFLKPAFAYSLHWYLICALFIIGYFKLFCRLGLNQLISLSASFTLYFSTISQFWWDEKGPVFAFFPWVVYFLLVKIRPVIALLAVYWLSCSWLITDFYPPYVISLGFVGGIFFLAYGSHWFTLKRIISLAATLVVAVITTLLYLKDYLIKTSKTTYPGHRSLSGGSLSWDDWFSQLFPFSTFDKSFEVFSATNISEIGAVGVPLLLLVLTHINFKKPIKCTPEKQVKISIYLCLISLILMNLWMLAPVPDWAGKIFLWNNVHPVRMKFAAGVMLTFFTLIIANYVNFVVNTKRFIVYSLVILIGWFATKISYAHIKIDSEFFANSKKMYQDLYFIPALAISYLLVKRFKFTMLTAFACCSAIVTALVTAPFNPVQSAQVIFGPHEKIKNVLDGYLDKENNVLAVAGYPGATLNGLGYRSVTHVTAVPALSLWRKYFPGMDEGKYLSIFNRYSHIHLENINEPYSSQPDVVNVPLKLFSTKYYYPEVNQGKIIPLNKNAVFSGTIKDLPAGDLIRLSPLIGNYNNTARGILLLKVCNGSSCEKTSIRLENTLDNLYAQLVLPKPLNVKPHTLTSYEFKIESASDSSIVLWGSDSKSNLSVLGNTEEQQINLVPNLEIEYGK